MDWKKLIQTHKEIVKRGEDDFFTLYEETRASRSSSIKSFSLSSFSGPWETNVELLNNNNFSTALIANQHEQFFIGGPLFFSGSSSKLYPLIYKEVDLRVKNTNEIVIDPMQSKWFVSPPMVRAILQIDYIDDFDEWLKEKIESLNNNNAVSIDGIINSFLDDFPSLNEIYSFDSNADNWFIFSPPARVSSFNVHLMRDYENLEKNIGSSPGGLTIFNKQQKTEKTEMELMPLVQLNHDQEKAVRTLLSNNPLSVITGPPGTGKSQVVVSALLNAWTQGKTVLFASTNNAAVDVIKDRLDEFNAGFPLYVRGGAKSRNNIDDVLQQVLMFAQDDESLNLKDLAAKEKILKSEVKELKDLIESKKPQQITELYQSAENAYSECLKEKLKLTEQEDYFKKQMKSFFNKSVTVEVLNSKTKILNNWAEKFKESHTNFQNNSEELKNIESKLLLGKRTANEILEPWKIDLKEVNDLNWVLSSSPDEFKKINNEIESHVNNLLLEEDPGQAMSDIDPKWETADEVNDSLRRLKKINAAISQDITNYENKYRKLKAAQKQHQEISQKCLKAGLKETVKVDTSYFTDWIRCWLDYQATPKNFFSKLPFGEVKNLSRKLLALEASFNQEIPMKIWRELGELNDDSRAALAEYIELLQELSEKQNGYSEEVESYEEVISNYQEFKKDAIEAKVLSTELPTDVDWDTFISVVEANIVKANNAIKAFSKISAVIEISRKIKICTNKVFIIRADQPLVKEWFKTDIGSRYESIINSLDKNCNHDSADRFKSFYDQKALSSITDSWAELIKIYKDSIPHYEAKAVILNSPEFKKIIKKFPVNDINKPEINSFDDYEAFIQFNNEINKLNNDYAEFISSGKNKLASSSQEELSRALSQLKIATEMLENPAKQEMTELINKIHNADLDKWPEDELYQGFSGFNETSLKAKLNSKYSEIASLAFEKAKGKWFKKISTNSSLQSSISSLRRKLGSNKNIIPENSFVDFKNVLKAIPIWISTAQATQSIPMMPELFDIVIMDEASQCTMTHAIPLIYRGKSFAAIGDPNQLPAIPSIKREEENAIASSLEYDNYPDHLRHYDNNVYLSSFLNLYQAPKNQILLREHFRSHPLIIGFSNLNIYYEKYKKPLLIKNVGKHVGKDDGVSHVQVSGESIKPSQGGSWINPKEASAVIQVIRELKSNPKNNSLEIGVVTPYRKQADLITDELTKEGLIAGVSIGTAHIYQGQEKDIMIFSTVVSNGIDSNSALWLSKPPNLLNVAMTRARKRLIIVGDMDYCENNFSGDMLGKLAKYCKKIDKLSKISLEQKKLFELLILNGIEPEIEYPIADMHVDFCISTNGQNIVIEVDGEQHNQQQAHDQSRDALLRSLNFKVLRYSARDVRETPNIVIEKILENIK